MKKQTKILIGIGVVIVSGIAFFMLKPSHWETGSQLYHGVGMGAISVSDIKNLTRSQKAGILADNTKFGNPNAAQQILVSMAS